jgi:Domain of unknown function (DUF4326)
MTPQRIQLHRTAGFNLQATSRALNGLPAVKVDRSCNLGNPFRAKDQIALADWSHLRSSDSPLWWASKTDHPDYLAERMRLATAFSVANFRALALHTRRTDPAGFASLIGPVIGHNVACWCALDACCHGDVWLELANG